MVKKISEVPEGIKILSFVLFVGALFSLTIGVVLFGSSDAFRNADPTLLAEASLSQISPWIMIFAGIGLILVGFFQYLLGRDLLLAKNWSKIAIGVFSVLGIISAIINFTTMDYASGTLGIVLNGVIIWYLFVREKTKKFFD